MHLLNWQLVRLLSSLSLLNRLAFSMLIVVPLLAAFWSPMRNATGAYNDAVTQARKDIGLNTETAELPPLDSPFEAEASPSTDESTDPRDTTEESQLPAAEAATSEDADGPETRFLLPPRLRSLLVTWFPRVVGKPELPRPWALAFFAALFILMGDTIVQIFCPKIVREFSREEYVKSETAAFAAAPSIITLERAMELLAGQSDQADLLSMERNSQAGRKPVKVEDSAAPQTTPAQYQTEFDDLSRRIAIIEAASRIRYLALGKTRRVGALLSLLCYSGSGCVIVKILQEQAWNVARASGWTQ